MSSSSSSSASKFVPLGAAVLGAVGLVTYLAKRRNAGQTKTLSFPNNTNQPAIVVVDPISTGARLAYEVISRGIPVVCLLSQEFREDLATHKPEGVPDIEYLATIDGTGAPEDTLKVLEDLPYKIRAIIPGAETGVELCDYLCYKMHLRGNDYTLSKCRRDKYLMGERVRESGTRAVAQKIASKYEDVVGFLDELNPVPFRVVVKPTLSAGSDGVTMCKSMDDVKQAFADLVGQTNLLGIVNDEVLVQEYLEGDEYVVDSVSMDGEHKFTAIWKYDKRPANGGQFVYYGMHAVSADTSAAFEMMEYTKKCLDAMGVKNGPAHSEIKWTSTGPCMVESGARPHGGDGTWLQIADKCIGRNQLEGTVDVYADPARFRRMPASPSMDNIHGAELYSVSYVDGKLVGLPYLERIRQLPSVRSLAVLLPYNTLIRKTVDCMSIPLSVVLWNTNGEEMMRDYSQIHKWEREPDFYTLE